MAYLYILSCIFLTVYGQLIIKWRMNMQEPLPLTFFEKVIFLTKLIILDPFILSGLISAFLASLFWMAAMSMLDVSEAYPFVTAGLTILIVLGGVFILGEAFSIYKFVGVSFILIGVVLLGGKV